MCLSPIPSIPPQYFIFFSPSNCLNTTGLLSDCDELQFPEVMRVLSHSADSLITAGFHPSGRLPVTQQYTLRSSRFKESRETLLRVSVTVKPESQRVCVVRARGDGKMKGSQGTSDRESERGGEREKGGERESDSLS